MTHLSRRQFSGQLTSQLGAGWLGSKLGPATRASARDGSSAYEIWDLHCHLFGVSGETPEQRAGKLIEFADRMGVNRLVFFMGFPPMHDPSAGELQRQNDQVMRVVEKWYPRLLGLAYLNARLVDESIDELLRCVSNGPLVGIKLWVARRCSDPAVDPIVQRIEKLQGIVYQHTWLKVGGNLSGESTPEDLAALAARHPNVPLICGHAGGDWELGIRSVRERQNVWIGTGGFDPTAGMIEMAVRDLGPDRIVFGSDVGGRSFASQLAKVLGAEISEDAKRSILSGNLQRMLRPILRAKEWPV